MNRFAWCTHRRRLLAALAGLALSIPVTARAAAEYDFVYVDAFQGAYDLRESYLFDLNNGGMGCGHATDLPSYSGFFWSTAADKTRLPFTYARGINEAGVVAGLNRVYDTVTGIITTIPSVPGAVAPPVALGINDQGVVVGYAETCVCSNSDHVLQIPFVWDAVQGSRSIPVAGAKELVKVNNRSVAVGNIRGGSPDGFVYEIATGRTLHMSAFLPTNPYPWTEAADINDLGMVTGRHRSNDAQSFHGYVWTEAAGATLLPHIAGRADFDVWPWALNDAGVVVGTAEIQQHVWRAFTWDAAHGIRDLNGLALLPPNFILDRALAINDRGWIAGDGHYGPAWSTSQAFVLIPKTDATVAVAPPPGAGLRLSARPNPAPGGVTIDYALESGGVARLGVFDLSGRRVAEVPAERGAGPHVARWDGRDASGRLVRPGLYLLRLEAAGRAIDYRLAVTR